MRHNARVKRYKAIAEYYDAEYANLEMLKHDVPFFLGQLPRKRQSILELAVGTARAAIPIAQAGHRIVGIDYARDLLTIAERKRAATGLKDRELSLVALTHCHSQTSSDGPNKDAANAAPSGSRPSPRSATPQIDLRRTIPCPATALLSLTPAYGFTLTAAPPAPING